MEWGCALWRRLWGDPREILTVLKGVPGELEVDFGDGGWDKGEWLLNDR